jgi:hypothetical protein
MRRACCRSAALSLALLAVLVPTGSSFAHATWEDIEAAVRKGGAAVLYRDTHPLSAERIVSASSPGEAANRKADWTCR